MNRIPSIDMHAHIEPDISVDDLLGLGALVFAATRSLDEAERVLKRSDLWTVWGVGCHPGLIGAQKAFDRDRFAQLITSTSYVSEVGLDGKSRVPREMQRRTFDAILSVLQGNSRLASIHSFAATEEVLQCLAARPIQGAVLHWWQGSEEQTKRAIELGCYFSVNATMVSHAGLLATLPLNRVLAETDHPFGDKSGGRGRRPGRVEIVERALARVHGVQDDEVCKLIWRNFSWLVRSTKCGSLLPRPVRMALVAGE
jgi:TatD DNase family protein